MMIEGLSESEALGILRREDRARRRGRTMLGLLLVPCAAGLFGLPWVLDDLVVFPVMYLCLWAGFVLAAWRRPDLLTGGRYDDVDALDPVTVVAEGPHRLAIRLPDGARKAIFVADRPGRPLPGPGTCLWVTRRGRFDRVALVRTDGTDGTDGPRVLWPRSALEIDTAPSPEIAPETGRSATPEEVHHIESVVRHPGMTWVVVCGLLLLAWLGLLIAWALNFDGEWDISLVNAVTTTFMLGWFCGPKIVNGLTARRAHSFERVDVLDVDRYGFASPAHMRIRRRDGQVLLMCTPVVFGSIRVPGRWVWASTPVEPGRRIVLVAPDPHGPRGARLLPMSLRARETVDLDLSPASGPTETSTTSGQDRERPSGASRISRG